MENAGLMQEVQFQTSRSAEDIETDLGGLEGVRDVRCDPDNKVVTVRFDPTIVDENLIKKAVEGGTGESGELPGSNAQPVAGVDAGYGPVDRGTTTQGQPPTTTV